MYGETAGVFRELEEFVSAGTIDLLEKKSDFCKNQHNKTLWKTFIN